MSIRKQFILLTAAISVASLRHDLLAQGALIPGTGPAPLFKSLDQIESRTPISGSTTISSPGAYYLTGNITVASGNGITIAASSVQLDLKGFTISSTAEPADGTGIALSGVLTNVTIIDGFIYGSVTNNGASAYGGSGFTDGITFLTAQPFNVHVAEMSVSGCTVSGINLNSNVGNNTGNTVERCLVNNCGTYGITADMVIDCIANAGASAAIFCGVAARDRGICYGGLGLHAANNAQDCFGQSTSYIGLNAPDIGNNCYGQSTGHYGLSSGMAHNCYGSTSTGGAGLYSTVSANNCYGVHNGAGGGAGLFVSSVGHGCVGVNSSPLGYGIYSDGLLSGCVGSGTTNTAAKFKANTP